VTTEILVPALVVAILVLGGVAALFAAALLGKGPLYGRFLEIDRGTSAGGTATKDETPAAETPNPAQGVRLLVRGPRPEPRDDGVRRMIRRPSDDELEDVLQGSFAAETYNRVIRVLAWSFILSVMLIVSVSQLWQPVQPAIYVTLIVAGILVLVVHEIVSPTNLGTVRMMLEASAAIVFLTMIVLLTGNSSSPFFLIYPLLVGGAALVASPRIAALLTLETVIAYGVAAIAGPLTGDLAREALARVAINLTALILLSYSGMSIAKVQRRTRDAAIRLSTLDSLTELYNRAFLFNAVEREIQRSRRFKRGFCLLMMDLDGLKSINDRYGHFHGDVVLRAVAQIIREGSRGVDMAARYGGDEFVALLPETESSGAYVVAEKIRQGVTELVIDAAGQQITTSLSIGVVSYPEDGETADELMIAADEAMYLSKRLGKNRVVGYIDPDEMGAEIPQPLRTPVGTPGFRPLSRRGEGREPDHGERP
jgi:diguanylate cyclase (GGDEF)-like protein